MWTCPDCGRSFANRNQWHACQTTTVEEVLHDKTDLAVSIYKTVVEALESAGEFRIHPQKTKIAFISRMTFAGVSLAKRWVDLSFILPKPLDDERVRKLELYGPTSWGHTVRLSNPDEVDASVRLWLAEGLRRGDQATLDPLAEVEPLNMRQLEVFWAGFTATVESLGDDIAVALPGYVADAVALVGAVTIRVGGVRFPATIDRVGSRALMALDPSLGLGEGDTTDVFIEMD